MKNHYLRGMFPQLNTRLENLSQQPPGLACLPTNSEWKWSSRRVSRGDPVAKLLVKVLL